MTVVIALFGPERVRRRVSDDPRRAMIALAVTATLGAGAFMILTGRRRGARDVLARSGRVCTGCRYPLPPTEKMGVCPECGDPYTLDDNVIAWRARYPWLQL